VHAALSSTTLEHLLALAEVPVWISDSSATLSGQVLATYSPEAGKFNVATYAPPGTPPFSARSGTAFWITLLVASSVQDGTCPVTIATSEPSLAASSRLSDEAGDSLAHTALAGSVVVNSAITCDLSDDHRVTLTDLLLLIRDWHTSSTVPLLPFDINGDTVVDERDVLMFSKAWMREYQLFPRGQDRDSHRHRICGPRRLHPSR